MRPPPLSPLRIGIWAAIVVAGPPLYLQVTGGELTSGGAVAKGAVVALACAVGAAFVWGLLADYEVEARRAEEKYLAQAILDELRAEAGREQERAGGPPSG